MAKHNVRGSRLAKQLCEKLDVPYKQCGAMVLGFDEEDEKTVRMLYQRGLNNGVEGLEILNKEQILEKEPQISSEVRIALLAKTSAIVSPWEYALALAETAVRNGVELKLNNEVKAIKKTGETFLVTTDKGIYEGKYIINCAGLYADKIQEILIVTTADGIDSLIGIGHSVKECVDRRLQQFHKGFFHRVLVRTTKYAVLQNVEDTGGVYGGSTEANVENLIVIVSHHVDQTSARLLVLEGVHLQRKLGKGANLVETEAGIQASKGKFVHGKISFISV
jgi:glycine/D-amino acid oxidase-like deaminating enzyme